MEYEGQSDDLVLLFVLLLPPAAEATDCHLVEEASLSCRTVFLPPGARAQSPFIQCKKTEEFFFATGPGD